MIITCAILLLAHMVISLAAVWQKAGTVDEVGHLGAAWARFDRLDFRVNPEDPPLVWYWAALPLSLMPNPPIWSDNTKLWDAMPTEYETQFPWTVQMVYRTPGNDADTMFKASRTAMAIFSPLLGALAAWWAYRLAGGVAAVVTAAIYSLDPNFLAHGPLVKNDVSAALGMLATAASVWQLGKRVTPGTVALAALAVTAAITIKFSGLLVVPVLIVTLLVRALVSNPWIAGDRVLQTRLERLACSLALLVMIGIVSYASIWAMYGFRFEPVKGSDVRFPIDAFIDDARTTEIYAKNKGDEPRPEQVEQWTPGAVIRLALWFDEHRLLPHAFLAGIIATDAHDNARYSFFRGQVKVIGSPWYFPTAVALKTPIVTLLLVVASAAVGVATLRRRLGSAANRWAAVCLLLIPLTYAIVAFRSNLNLGLRHFLPVYPFLFIGVGCAAAWVVGRGGARVGRLVAGLVVVLGVESVKSFPDFIPFFNVIAGGPRGGVDILGDSNLDWGQDLTTLVRWRKEHPEGTLYLGYFGRADPLYHGLTEAVHLKGTTVSHPSKQIPLAQANQPGYIAISATLLQGLGVDQEEYVSLSTQKPLEVLGGSIYIFPSPAGLPSRAAR